MKVNICIREVGKPPVSNSAPFQCLENQEMEAKLESGLIVGHAYGVSRVYEVLQTFKINVI